MAQIIRGQGRGLEISKMGKGNVTNERGDSSCQWVLVVEALEPEAGDWPIELRAEGLGYWNASLAWGKHFKSLSIS